MTVLEDYQVNDVPGFLMENVNWHSALAVASHNDLLHAFATSVSGLMFEASQIKEFAAVEVRERVIVGGPALLGATALVGALLAAPASPATRSSIRWSGAN